MSLRLLWGRCLRGHGGQLLARRDIGHAGHTRNLALRGIGDADARMVERHAGRWNGDAPPPPLPASVIDATSKRYLEAYRRVTGAELKIV